MYDGCESGMAEQHDGRVTDKQPALILLHKGRICRMPGSTPRRSSGMAGQSGVNISGHPANFSKSLYDTVPHKDSVPLEK